MTVGNMSGIYFYPSGSISEVINSLADGDYVQDGDVLGDS